MGGRFFDFPIHPGAYIVIAGDESGTAIEILPQNTVMIPGESEVETREIESARHQYYPFHAALSVPVSLETIEEIGMREGWLVRFCDRGPFEVMELWIENNLLVELITPEMMGKYQNFMQFDTYASFLNSTPVSISN